MTPQLKKAIEVIEELSDMFSDKCITRAVSAKTEILQGFVPEYRYNQINEAMTDLANLYIDAGNIELATELLEKTVTIDIPKPNKTKSMTILEMAKLANG